MKCGAENMCVTAGNLVLQYYAMPGQVFDDKIYLTNLRAIAFPFRVCQYLCKSEELCSHKHI